MFSLFLTPLLKCFTALLSGLALCCWASLVHAQTLPDIQRMMKQGQLPQALEKVDVYISTKPKEAQGRFLKGLILTEMGRSVDAIAVFTKLTEDFPELPEPYNNLAVLYAQQKQYDKARSALEMAIRTHPSYSIAHENLGDVYAKLASQAYDKALQIDSSNAATQTKLSMIKEMISTSSKPAIAPRPVSETPKQPAADPAKIAPSAKPSEKTAEPPSGPKTEKTAAVSKPVEAKVSDEKASPTPGNDTEINKMLQAWVQAWSRKDVKSYLSFYANEFQTPNGMARKSWENERSQRIDKPGKLQVSIDDIKISLDGDKATVRFRQHYTSSTLKSSTSKTLVLVKSGGKWQIQQERVG